MILLDKAIFLDKQDLAKIESAKADAIQAMEKCKESDDFLCAMMTEASYHDNVRAMFADEFAQKYHFDMAKVKGWNSKTGQVNMKADGEEDDEEAEDDEEEAEAEEEEE